MTMLYNIITPHISKLIVDPCLKKCLQCCDRSCSRNLRLNPDDKKDDRVNTSKQLHSELTALYTGPQISSAYVYA